MILVYVVRYISLCATSSDLGLSMALHSCWDEFRSLKPPRMYETSASPQFILPLALHHGKRAGWGKKISMSRFWSWFASSGHLSSENSPREARFPKRVYSIAPGLIWLKIHWVKCCGRVMYCGNHHRPVQLGVEMVIFKDSLNYFSHRWYWNSADLVGPGQLQSVTVKVQYQDQLLNP